MTPLNVKANYDALEGSAKPTPRQLDLGDVLRVKGTWMRYLVAPDGKGGRLLLNLDDDVQVGGRLTPREDKNLGQTLTCCEAKQLLGNLAAWELLGTIADFLKPIRKDASVRHGD